MGLLAKRGRNGFTEMLFTFLSKPCCLGCRGDGFSCISTAAAEIITYFIRTNKMSNANMCSFDIGLKKTYLRSVISDLPIEEVLFLSRLSSWPKQNRGLGNGVRKNGVRNRVRFDDAWSILLKFRIGFPFGENSAGFCKSVWLPVSILNFRIGSVSSMGGVIAATLFAATVSDSQILRKNVRESRHFGANGKPPGHAEGALQSSGQDGSWRAWGL